MSKKNKKLLIKSTVAIICTVIIILTGIYFAGQNSVNYENKDFVAVLDVGQGDSILICSNGDAALIDTGEESFSRDAIRKIRGYGVNSLDALIISHSHDDHSGGAEYLLGNMPIDNVITPEFRSDEKVSELNIAIERSGAESYCATQGMVINIGDFEITVLYADNSEEDINNRSIVLMAEIEGKKFLFTGDAEKQVEKSLIESGIDFDCDVLKVGHHGSGTSTTQEFIDIATPEYAAISVGADNSYGHPNKSVVSRLESASSRVLRTDYSGDLIFNIENGEIEWVN